MNQLKMDIQQTISTLTRSCWSQRRIARELGIDRETVARYRRLARQAGEPNPAISPTGSEVPTAPSNLSARRANPAISPAGSGPVEGLKPAIAPAGPQATKAPSNSPAQPANPAIVPPGLEVTRALSTPPTQPPNPAVSPAGSKPGRVSHCEPFESFIKAGLDARLSAQRIYQDLVSEQRFAGSYDSVKRFVRQLHAANPLPFRRMESEPGQEAQVDFGQGCRLPRMRSKTDLERTRPAQCGGAGLLVGPLGTEPGRKP